MLRVMPLLSSDADGPEGGALFKYFLPQGAASVVFIFSLIRESHPLSARLASAALFLKLGVAPFHGWLLRVIRRVSLPILGLLATVQKILPLVASEALIETHLFFLVLLFRLFVVSGMLLLRANLRTVMFISSLGNMAVVLTLICCNHN